MSGRDTRVGMLILVPTAADELAKERCSWNASIVGHGMQGFQQVTDAVGSDVCIEPFGVVVEAVGGPGHESEETLLQDGELIR